MTFEEEFPSLKGKQTNIHEARKYVADLLRKDFYEYRDIKKFCLDKARVKAAILTFLTDWKVEQITCICPSCSCVKESLIERDKLLRELKL